MSDEECGCADARAWREYWSAEAIGRRLAEELAPLQWAYQASIRDACNDVRGPSRMSNAPPPNRPPPYAELEARRAVPGAWPPPGV